RRRHTRFSRDWSSDVCSSDLKRHPVRLLWSPDGQHFVLTRKDNRHLSPLWVINNVGLKRPTLETYKYLMPGETDSTEVELHIFETKSLTSRQLPVAARSEERRVGKEGRSRWSAER